MIDPVREKGVDVHIVGIRTIWSRVLYRCEKQREKKDSRKAP